MMNATKIKVKIKSPKGTMASGMMDSDMPKTATLKETARALRADNLRKEAKADDNMMAARRLRAENLRKQASPSDNMMAARKLRAENLRKS
jgi:hypothetical protein